MGNVYDRDMKGNAKCPTCQRTTMFVPVRIAIDVVLGF